MDIKRMMTDVLEDLVDKELKQFIWQLCNNVTAGIEPIPRAKLQTSDREDVVDCMVYIPTSRSQRKGLALLITNIKFDHLSHRDGAEKDEANMEWLLTALGYSVEKHTNLSGDAINMAVKNFSKRHEHRDSDSTFVVIMSHGERIQNKDAIIGVRYQRNNPNDIFFVEDIFSHLNSEKCPALIDKPKVILIQACRGGKYGGLYVSDSAPESDSWVHREKDFVCFMSSLPEIAAYRDPANGSYFIMYIVDVFSTSAHKYGIMELFRRVASRMEKDQRFTHEMMKLLPCIERTTLVRKFYLFPGL
ncbi:hypothetical protein G5714_000132 [Onychostoma macrolepis]|uniref:Uncharacterized protein n=1 Tax=Onychostoma macrolepis TaxID=369639 RepID=A0A7J6DG71_9TELE|nr:hypothetical protein G5714_000132 [Onychostoma macrolepis]